MIYADICAGISAATVAWKPLGWRGAFYSESDKFASGILATRFPETPNLGDMTRYEEWPDAVFNVLVGGTPCQGFSLAGLRKGMDDPRSNLALGFGLIAQRYRPEWIVWENVPGVRSSWSGAPDGESLPLGGWDGDETSDLDQFIAGLVECGYGVCYRSFDAQYAGLAQRRERVFAVGYLGDWRPAAAVLFEPEGMRWDSAPVRQTREDVTGTLAARAGGGGRPDGGDGRHSQLVAALSPTLPAGGNETGGHRPPGMQADTVEALVAVSGGGVAGTVSAKWRKGTGGPAGDEHYNLIAFNARQDPDSWGERTGPLDTKGNSQAVAFKASHFTRGKDGAPRPTAPALSADADKGDQDSLVLAFQPRFARNDRGGPQEELAYPLTAEAGRTGKGDSAQCIAQGWAVRRFTPRECERLMGFPDDHTLIPWRGKESPDGQRYRVLGNSISVPDLRWIGRRIQLCDDTIKELKAA